jgi:hypothetical protein
MLIEELIRLGRPLLHGDMKPEEVLRLITDVTGERVKNFYRNVFVVLLPEDANGEVRALAPQVFGREEGKDFHVDAERALGIPFVFPGANPTNPQGPYGLPVYPVFHKHIYGQPKAKRLELKLGFLKSAKAVQYFLEGRLKRTPGFDVDPTQQRAISEVVHSVFAKADFGDAKKVLAVLILVRPGGAGFFRLEPAKGHTTGIGRTPDGMVILPDFAKALSTSWEAKLSEGREKGSRPGPCSIAGTGEQVVSAYCKAWPWALPTWTCPLPNGGDVNWMVEGIGLSAESYRALTLGACVFNRLTKRLSHVVVPEMFSPADTRPGREQAQKRKNLPSIFGSAFLLPVRNETLAGEREQHEFVKGVRGMLAYDPEGSTQADRSIATVTGVEQIVPEEFGDDYRLTLVYFSKGKTSDADIHLRAFIQDVVPSRLGQLREIARDEAIRSMKLVRTLTPAMSEKQQNWLARRYQSVPYLLTRAYGGPYLWAQLESVLHGRRLDPCRVTRNFARRLESLVPAWPQKKSRFAIRDEVAFYLNFLRFLGRVNREVARTEDPPMPIETWREMLKAVDTGPVEELLAGPPEAAELGFACGAVIKRFSRRYYVGMRKTKPDADFLRDRVLTFGSALRWDAVQHRALRFINELPNNQLKKSIRFSRDIAERAAAISDALRRHTAVVERNRDDFLTAFWCGYALQGYERPRNSKTKATITQATEGQACP